MENKDSVKAEFTEAISQRRKATIVLGVMSQNICSQVAKAIAQLMRNVQKPRCELEEHRLCSSGFGKPCFSNKGKQ